MILQVLLSLSLVGSADGRNDILFRLGARFPDCRGILERAYEGDRFEFMHRARISAGGFGLVLVVEKDRGEEWYDLASAGASLALEGTGSISAGWLRTDLGSGLVLAHPSDWSGGGGVEAKPPALRRRVEPATSPGCSDAEPMTGAGATLDLWDFGLAALFSAGRVDPSGEGLHRTDSEIGAERSVREILGGFRLERGSWGLSAAVADDQRGDWARASADFDGYLAGMGLTAEAALGGSDGKTVEAFWVCIHEEVEDLRFLAGSYRIPEGFPSRRSSVPFGETADAGAGAALRWRPAGGWSTEFSACASLEGEESASRVELSVEKGLTPSFDCGLRSRGESASEGSCYRLVGYSEWRPAGGVVLTTSVQGTGADSPDGRSDGSAAEARLRLLPVEGLSLRLGAAGFDTDGYDSRVYCGELSFPGEFASVQLWGEGVYLQCAATAAVAERSEVSARVGYLRKGSGDHIGEGWEETEGPSRVEASLQLEVDL